MNSNDFIFLPWGKSGNSIKLKTKNVRELRVEKVQLELETQEMEKKLQQLQSSMSREKEERERSNGYHWKSGQVDKLGHQSQVMSQNKENVIKISPGKVKLKVLKDKVTEPVKPPLNCKVTNTSIQEKVKTKGKICGQCENKFALLVCLECGEDYCSSCFARIHQKGALKRHRTTLLQTRAQVLSRLDITHRFLKEIYPDEPQEEHNLKKDIIKSENVPKALSLETADSEVDSTLPKMADITNQTGGLLLRGSFDEEESAKSFQEILTQWRNGNHENKEKEIQKKGETSPEHMEETEVQTNLKIWREPLQIEFKEDSLTYMDRLWLKKFRRTPLLYADTMPLEKEKSPSTPTNDLPTPLTASTEDLTLNEKVDIIEVEEVKENHPALFIPEQPEETFEKLVSSVTIVELDDNYEEENGEPADFVPYKVELADTDSQQSWTVHEYQMNDVQFGKDLPFSSAKATEAVRQHENLIKDNEQLAQCRSTSSSASEESVRALSSRSSTSDSPTIIERVPTVCSEKHVKKKKKVLSEKIKTDGKAHASCQKTLYQCTVDLGDFHGKRSTYHCFKDSLEGNRLQESSTSHGSRSTKTSKLQKIALRSKPVTEQYQGLEKFFVSGKSPWKERLKFIQAKRPGSGPSNSRIFLIGNQKWISAHSLSEHADDSVVQDVVRNNQKKAPSMIQHKRGPISQRPSSANIPLCKMIRNGSQSHRSLYQRPRSAADRPMSRATSEISEIEYLDITEQNEPNLEDAADHQTLDNLEKELNTLKNLSDAPEKLYTLKSEKLSSGIKKHLGKISKNTKDVPKISGIKGSGRLGISRKHIEVHRLLSSSESSIDEEEESSLEKQQVIALH